MALNVSSRGPSSSSSSASTTSDLGSSTSSRSSIVPSQAGSAAYMGSTMASSASSNAMATAPSIAATGNTVAMQETYMQQQEALTQAGISNMARQAQLNFQKEMAELNAKTITSLAKSLSGLAPQ